jgi:hypothetical protein
MRTSAAAIGGYADAKKNRPGILTDIGAVDVFKTATLPLRRFVAGAGRVGAVFSVAEAVVGTVNRLRLTTPEIAVAGSFLSRWQACVDIQAFGEQVTATDAGFDDLQFVGHGLETSFQQVAG